MNPSAPYSREAHSLTPAVKVLLLANIGSFLIAFLVGLDRFEEIFGLAAPGVFSKLHLYQLVTYLFVHSDSSHLILNMFFFWMFGRELEAFWGTAYFVKYYFITGVGAGFCSLPFIWGKGVVVVGASGSVFALLLAYGVLFPERIVSFLALIRMKAKYLVLFFIGLELLLLLGSGRGGGIAHFAHLGGALVGWLYLKGPPLRRKRDGPGDTPSSLGPSDDFRLELDRILDKLADDGWEGLTDQEKDFLNEAQDKI